MESNDFMTISIKDLNVEVNLFGEKTVYKCSDSTKRDEFVNKLQKELEKYGELVIDYNLN